MNEINIDWPSLVGACLWVGLLGFTGILWTLIFVACRWIVLVTT